MSEFEKQMQERNKIWEASGTLDFHNKIAVLKEKRDSLKIGIEKLNEEIYQIEQICMMKEGKFKFSNSSIS